MILVWWKSDNKENIKKADLHQESRQMANWNVLIQTKPRTTSTKVSHSKEGTAISSSVNIIKREQQYVKRL